MLVQDWFKDGQSRNRVRSAIEKVLDKELFKRKTKQIFEMIYNYASTTASNPTKQIYCSMN